MSTYPLSQGAELLIQNMHLAQADETVVRQCISRYSMPKNLCDLFTWVLFRTWNAVKYIFGRSDWQSAETIVYLRAKEIIIQENGLNPDSQDPTEVRLLGSILSAARRVVHKSLDACLFAHYTHSSPDEELKQKILKLDLHNISNEIKDVTKKSG